MRWNLIVAVVGAVGTLAASPQSKSNPNDDYGMYVSGPATPDADGVPVAKPNPMSDFRKRNRDFDNLPIGMPLIDDPRQNDPATGGQTK